MQDHRKQPLSRLFYSIAPKSIKKDFDFICYALSSLDGNGLSQFLLDALIVAEDHRFYQHPGVDIIAILRAIWSILFRRRIQGASTIEQQLVRTITKRYDLSILRKIREMYLSLMLSSMFPKERIARNYLSVAYFGWKMNGIGQVGLRLGFDLTNVSKRDAASAIARIRYPEPNNGSITRQAQIHNRTNYILFKLQTLEKTNGT